MRSLTDEELARQDYVDNQVFALIESLNPSSVQIQWNIEMIGNVRDVVMHHLVDVLQVCTATEFYPLIEFIEE